MASIFPQQHSIVVWLLLGVILLASMALVVTALRRWLPAGGFGKIAAGLAVGLLGLVAAVAVVRAAIDLPHRLPQSLDWIALAVTFAAVAASFWDRTARYPPAGLYLLALTAISMGEVQRGYSPGTFFLWGTVCEWTGLMIVAALVAWSFRRFPLVAKLLRLPDDRSYWASGWFNVVQAILAAIAALLTAWISMDATFDVMGADIALFGLSGRMACCPAALMLVGTAMLMAWQNSGAWRAGWQFAAIASGVLFTTSVAWARLDVDGVAADALWLSRTVNLMISTAMMALLTRFGLARVLPRSGDWITRARRAAPVFGGLAILCLIAVLVQWSLSR